MSSDKNTVTMCSNQSLEILDSGRFSDVRFLVGDNSKSSQLFKCHKVILCVASSVFEAMFYGGLPEKCDAPITLTDVDPIAFRMFLEYIYCGDVFDLMKSHAFALFDKLWYISEKYMVPKFREYCEKHVMSTEWDVKYTLLILDCAYLYDSSKWIQFCEKKIQQNENFYFDMEEILDVKFKTLTSVVECALNNYDKKNTQNKNENLFSLMFQKIDEYAFINNLFDTVCCSGECCLLKDESSETDPLADDKNEFRKFFEKLINDERIGKQEFYWGPAQSKLLCQKAEGFKILKKKYSDYVKVPRKCSSYHCSNVVY